MPDFDPIKEGATLSTEQFDPLKEGATLANNQLSQPPIKMVNTFLSQMPDPMDPRVRRQMLSPPTQADMLKAGAMLLPFVAPEVRALPFIGNALSKIPGIGGNIANFLSRIGYGAGVMGASGAMLPEQQKGVGELTKEALPFSAAIESLPPALKLAGKGIGYFQPQKYAQTILDRIGGGLNLADNAREFAKKIQDGYNSAVQKGKTLYDDIFNSSDPIRSNGINSAIIKEGNYSKLPEKITDKYNYDLEDLHNNFLENPSLKNAHELQSQLGFEVRKLEKADKRGTLSISDQNTLKGYQRARNSLLNDMNNSFESIEPGLGAQYNDAAENWLNTVIPYEQNPKLGQIVKSKPEKITGKMVQNISNEFKNPDEDILKIINDIGPDANHHIIYDKLGRLSGRVTPENLTSEINKLKNEGFGNYITPELDSMMEGLVRRQRARTGAQALPGALAGLSLGSKFGPGGEILGASVLAPLSVGLLRGANALLPGASPKTVNALSKLYRPSAYEAEVFGQNQ